MAERGVGGLPPYARAGVLTVTVTSHKAHALITFAKWLQLVGVRLPYGHRATLQSICQLQ